MEFEALPDAQNLHQTVYQIRTSRTQTHARIKRIQLIICYKRKLN